MPEQPGLFDRCDRFGRGAAGATVPLAVRHSSRARYLSLRLLPQRLELVVPRGTKPAQVADFVREQRAWIERASRDLPAGLAAAVLPGSVELRALERAWEIRYRQAAPGEPAALRTQAGRIDIRAPTTDIAHAVPLLRRWLRALAATHLKPWLMRESLRVGRAPRAVQVRLQQTRWGSCNSRGTIAVNAALLFLDAPLVRYLLVHELCHLHTLDHSLRYWGEVARHEPRWRELDRELAAAQAQVPAWVYAGRPGSSVILDVSL